MVEEATISDTVKIYCLIDPRTDIIRYIGKTIRPLTYRLNQHRREKGRNRKNNWIKSLKNKGLNPIIEIIDEVPSDDWQKHEMSYIRLFKSFGANLLNEKSGGEGGQFSEATIEKIRNSQKKKIVYQYDLQGNFLNEFISISEAARNTKSNVYHISSTCNRDRKRKGRIMENGFLWKFKNDVFDKSNIDSYSRIPVNRTIVYQYDRNGKFIKEWESLTKASSELGASLSKIVESCRNGRTKSAGFMFRYERDCIDKSDISPSTKSEVNLQKKYLSKEKQEIIEKARLFRIKNGGGVLKERKLSDEHRHNISLIVNLLLNMTH